MRALLACLAVAWVLAAALTSPAADWIVDNESGIRLRGPEPQLSQIKSLVTRTSKAVESFFPAAAPAPAPWLSVDIAEAAAPTPVTSPLLAVRPDAAAHEVVDSLAVRFVLHRVAAAGAAPGVDGPAFHFLAAAVAYEALTVRSADGETVHADYRALMPVFARGGGPSLVDLIEHPVPTRWPEAYELYAMHAHLAASLLRDAPAGNSRHALQAFLAALAAGTPSADALTEAVAGQLPADTSVQQWYESAARERIRGSHTADTLGQIQSRLEDALTVGVMEKDDQGRLGMRYVGIVEALRKADYTPPAETLDGKEQDLFALLRQSPPLLQIPIAECMEALRSLRKGTSRRSVIRDLDKARTHFKEATERMTRIEGLLDSASAIPAGGPDRLAPYLGVHADARDRARLLMTPLETYLDGVETGTMQVPAEGR